MSDAPTLQAPAGGTDAVPRIERQAQADGSVRIALSGAWVLRALLPQVAGLRRQLLAQQREPGAVWDLRGIAALDDAGALLLWRSWGRRRPPLQLRAEQEAIFGNLAPQALPAPAVPPPDPLVLLLVLGRPLLSLADHLHQVVLLSGHLVLDMLQILRTPALMPWREVSANVYRTGMQALPIIALVGLLVGVVLSYLSAKQLQAYGANIFIINILGVGIVRELGPMLAAILVAGRSGSSMTAQLGVMRVTEELDALAVMGICLLYTSDAADE